MSFLLNYWWLILLVIVVLAIIVRSVIKLIISTLVFLLVLFVLLKIADFIIEPTIKNLSLCYQNQNQVAQANYDKAKAEKWTKSQICQSSKSEIDTLSACYEQAQKGNLVSSKFAESLAKLIKPSLKNEGLDNFIKDYNQVCGK
jgi:hypothetical protein